MSTLGSRLREERERLGLSQVAFSEHGDVGKHSQINYENNRRNPDSKYLLSIAKIGVDILYVLTGVSEAGDLAKAADEVRRPEKGAFQNTTNANEDYRARQGEQVSQEVYPPSTSTENLPDLDSFSLVRRFDIGLSAGPGLIPVENAESDHIAVSRSWLRKHNLTSDQCVLVKVSGHSMSPTIPDSSLVLVDISDIKGTREGIYAFSRDGEAYIKRLVPVGVTADDKPAALVIVSDNPVIGPETISGEGLAEIRIVGRVRCVITDL